MSNLKKTTIARIIAGIATLTIIIGMVANSEAIGRKLTGYLIDTMNSAALSTAE